MRRVVVVAVLAVGCGFEEKEYVEPLGAGECAAAAEESTVGGEQGDVIALSALNCTTCAVREDGSVWCWGSNEFYQLGSDDISTGEPREVLIDSSVKMNMVSVGTTHACAVGEDGEVWCWGGNAAGQAAPQHWTIADFDVLMDVKVAPTRVPITDGAGNPVKVSSVGAGMLHTCALTVDKRVYCWGANYAGQCGRKLAKGLFERKPTDGKCGWTEEKLEDAITKSLSDVFVHTPAEVVFDQPVEELTVQRHTTCARIGNQLRCWGSNCGAGGGEHDSFGSLVGNYCSTGGQLGIPPDTTCYLDVPTAVNIDIGVPEQLALGHVSGFAIITYTQTGIASWGWNGGQLGHGASNPAGYSWPQLVVGAGGEPLRNPESIARTNGWHQHAKMPDGYYSWGVNHCGELGQVGRLPGPTSMSTVACRASRIPQGVTDLVSGQDHTCFVKNRSVYCLGHESYIGAPLGEGKTVSRCVGEIQGDSVTCTNPQLSPRVVRFDPR